MTLSIAGFMGIGVTDPPKPTRNRIRQRIIIHIRVPIEALRGLGIEHIRVGSLESSNHRVINPPVHVDQTVVVDLLVAGVAVVGVVVYVGIDGGLGGAQGADATAPSVVSILDDGGATGIADGDDQAEVVFVVVDRLVGAITFGGVLNHRCAAGVEGVFVFDFAVGGFYFKVNTGVDARTEEYRLFAGADGFYHVR